MPSSTRGRPARAPASVRIRPLLGALVAAGVIAPASLHAATIPVTTSGDAGNAGTCTLRQAADSINLQALQGICTNPSAVPFGTSDTVDLTGMTGTITLAGSAIGVERSTRFQGPGPTTLTVSGNGLSRVFEASNLGAIDLGLTDFTIANGRSTGVGGCVYGSSSSLAVALVRGVVTGCRADHDPSGPPFFNGLGGGIFAFSVYLEDSTVSGNVAQTAGGGIIGNYVYVYRSAVTGNTVTGHTCADTLSEKYCLSATLGGGGIVGVTGVQLIGSVVSGNTVNATTFTSIDGPAYRFGTGGGVTQIAKYSGGPPDMALAGSKATITGVRGALFKGATPATVVASRANFAKRVPASTGKVRAKADGVGPYKFAMRDSTLSGNRIVGGGGPVALVAKYGGAGAAFVSEYYNAEIANSTVSGNSQPGGVPCVYGPQVPGTVFSCGAGLVGDSFELTNSTVTGNTGATAVHAKYQLTTPPAFAAGAKSAKFAKALEGRPVLARWHARLQQAVQANPGLRSKSVAKAASLPILDSTIIAGNNATYDIGCTDDCTISGSNNLVRTRHSTVTLPGDTISANPNLAPLANNGGRIAGAPGVTGTGSLLTHALYLGSPAINAGSNIEGFEYDQRGPGFPRQTGSGVDIGAFEGAIPRPEIVPVPTLGAAALALLSGLLGAAGAFFRRRRRA